MDWKGGQEEGEDGGPGGFEGSERNSSCRWEDVGMGAVWPSWRLHHIPILPSSSAATAKRFAEVSMLMARTLRGQATQVSGRRVSLSSL